MRYFEIHLDGDGASGGAFIVSSPAELPQRTTFVPCELIMAKVREVIREVVGLAPYERKMMELIRTGVATKEKKAVKLARRRLGTHRRAQHKKAELVEMIRAQKKK